MDNKDSKTAKSAKVLNEIKPKISLEDKVARLGIGKFKRHMFLCVGDKCCSYEDGLKVFDYLKIRTAELAEQGYHVFRTKAACLRICQQGPIALVYPEGTWYKLVDIDTCEQIIQQHLIEGKEYLPAKIAENPLRTV